MLEFLPPLFTATLAQIAPYLPGHLRHLPYRAFRFAHTNGPGPMVTFPSSPTTPHSLFTAPDQALSVSPPINRKKNSKDPSALLDDKITDDFFNHGLPALAHQCFRLHRLSYIHLGSPPPCPIFPGGSFFCRYASFVFNSRPIFPLSVNTKQCRFNPTVPNPSSAP